MPTETIENISMPTKADEPIEIGQTALKNFAVDSDPAGPLYQEFPSVSSIPSTWRDPSQLLGGLVENSSVVRHQPEVQSSVEDHNLSPESESETLQRRINDFKAKTRELEILFDQCLEDQWSVTDELRNQACEKLTAISDLLPRLVMRADVEADRPAIRDVILTMARTLESYDRLNKYYYLHIFSSKKYQSTNPYTQAMKALGDSLSFSFVHWDYERGYYRHEEGSVFSEDEQKEIFGFLLKHSGYGRNSELATHYIRMKSRDFLNNIGQHESFWRDPTFLEHIGRMVAEDSIKPENGHWAGSDRELLARAFEGYGFEPEEQKSLTRAWESYTHDPNKRREVLATRYAESFSVMSQLMRNNTTMQRDLFTNFGIRNFYRFKHSTAELISQWDIATGQRPNPGANIRLVVAAVDDHNGAMDDQPQRFGAMNPVYTEAATLSEMARRVVFTRKHFGLISNLTINAHGQANSFSLSDRHGLEGEKVTKKDVLGSRAVARLRNKNYFTNGCEIILASCSTGVEEGIGQAIAEQSKIDVVAPVVDSYSTVHKAKNGKYEVRFTSDNISLPRFWQKPFRRKEGEIGTHLTEKGRKKARRFNLHD